MMYREKLGNINYVYVYLDNRKPGKWEYKDLIFNYQPMYIGRGIDARIDDHVTNYYLNNKSYKSNILNIIINVLRENPIRFKVYQNLSLIESNNIEKEMIKHFGRVCDGTGILCNIKAGGDDSPTVEKWNDEDKKRLSEISMGKFNPLSKRVDQFDLEGHFVRKWNSFTCIVRGLELRQIDYVRIKECCEGKRDSAIGFVWKYDGTSPFEWKINNPQIKPIFQYSLEGEFMAEFPSGREAARRTGFGPRTISVAARGEIRQAFGFQWFFEYKGKKCPPVKNAPKRRIVQMSDLDGRPVKTFETLRVAAKEIGVNEQFLGRIIKNNKSYNGYLWSFNGPSSLPIRTRKSKRVLQLNDQMEVINRFESSREAAEFINAHPKTISRNILRSKRFRGFYWRYEKDL